MKRFGTSLAGLLLLAVPGWAGELGACFNHGIHCACPPPPDHPDCSCPCEHGLHRCSEWKTEHANRLIVELTGGCCCDRVRAARKLGHRIHADFCCDPQVLDALIGALVCDRCWEVRRAAAWSIALQNARTPRAVLALYVASKLDPHYQVRDQASESLDLLLVSRRDCFKGLFTAGDAVVKELRGKYKPGTPECAAGLARACGACGIPADSVPLAPLSTPAAEQLPAAPAPSPAAGGR